MRQTSRQTSLARWRWRSGGATLGGCVQGAQEKAEPRVLKIHAFLKHQPAWGGRVSQVKIKNCFILAVLTWKHKGSNLFSDHSSFVVRLPKQVSEQSKDELHLTNENLCRTKSQDVTDAAVLILPECSWKCYLYTSFWEAIRSYVFGIGSSRHSSNESNLTAEFQVADNKAAEFTVMWFAFIQYQIFPKDASESRFQHQLPRKTIFILIMISWQRSSEAIPGLNDSKPRCQFS